MKENLNLTLIQANLFWKDVDVNLSQFEDLLSDAKETDIILLPEMFNTAFCPKSSHLAETMNGETVNWMKQIAKRKNCAIAGSIMIKENEKVYNRLLWISKEGNISTYDKRHLFSLIKEDKNITRGEKRLIVEVEGWKICPFICYLG